MTRVMGPEGRQRRYATLDGLKVAMALMVVGLHGSFLQDYSASLWWYSSNGLFRMAVPAFMVINGYFFPAEDRHRQKRWLIRIGLLYVAWTAIYAPIWVPDVHRWRTLLVYLALGWFQLWYLAGSFGAALVFMALQRVGRGVLGALAIACLLAGVALQYAAYEIAGPSLIAKAIGWHPVHRNFLLFSFPYFTFGYLMRTWCLERSVPVAAAAVAVLLGLALLLVEVTVVHRLPYSGRGLDNLLSLGLLAPAAVLLALKLPVEHDWARPASRLANGIYLTHPLFLVGLGLSAAINHTAATLAAALASAVLTGLIGLWRPLAKWLL
jgi:surface polysaccharide O-acyltransferase-like enzyme